MKRGANFFIVLLCSAVLLFLLTAGRGSAGSGSADTDSDPGGSYTEILPASDPYLLLFEDDGENSLLVTGGSDPTAVLFTEDGEPLSSFPLSSGLLTAKWYGGSIYTFSSSGNKILAEEYDLATGELLGFCSIAQNPGSLTFITCDGAGNSYLVTNREPTTLFQYDSSGEEIARYEFDGDISFLDLYDDMVWVYQDGNLIRFHTDDTPEDGERLSTPYIPAKLVDPELYVEADGGFCRADGSLIVKSGTRPDTPSSPLPTKQLHCADESQNLYFASGIGTVSITDNLGEPISSCRTEDTLMGVNANGILVYRNGSLAFAPYDSFPQTELPEEPGDLPEGIPVEGNYILVECGKTVSAMEELLDNEITLNGTPIHSGLCRTGMEVKYGESRYLICVMGDANGSGTVNSTDIKLVQKHLTGESPLEGVFAFAADLSRNGSIGCEDLALMASRFSS